MLSDNSPEVANLVITHTLIITVIKIHCCATECILSSE